MDNRAGEMQVFVRVVEAGSFSEAARQLQMTPSTVSKLIGRLEDRLGVRLIERSTRRLALSDEGRLFFERSVALLADLGDIEREVSRGAGAAGGTVRVNASVAFGAHCIEPLLPGFWSAHPNVEIDLSLSDEVVDLYLDRTDVAFRVGALADSSLIARRVGTARRMIVASPAYLQRAGTPATIADLGHHACLGFNFRRARPTWPVGDGGRGAGTVGRLRANNGETVRRLALAGAGLARLADFHVAEDIAEGTLVEVLGDAGFADEEEVHALYPGGGRMPQRIRLFLDFMIPRLQARMAGARGGRGR